MTTDSGRAGNVADPDAAAIAIAYVRLALRLDQHLPGFVDGYFGPPALKAQVDLEALPSLKRAGRRRGRAADPGRGRDRLSRAAGPG